MLKTKDGKYICPRNKELYSKVEHAYIITIFLPTKSSCNWFSRKFTTSKDRDAIFCRKSVYICISAVFSCVRKTRLFCEYSKLRKLEIVQAETLTNSIPFVVPPALSVTTLPPQILKNNLGRYRNLAKEYFFKY